MFNVGDIVEVHKPLTIGSVRGVVIGIVMRGKFLRIQTDNGMQYVSVKYCKLIQN